MAVETAPASAQNFIERTCEDCGDDFYAKKAPKPTPRCDPCRKARRKEVIRGLVQKHRAFNPVDSEADDPEPKEFPLVCGHSLWFRVYPQDGEYLYCCRCQDWCEYQTGQKRSLCDLKLHRMTPFNTGKDDTGASFCRQCEDTVSTRREGESGWHRGPVKGEDNGASKLSAEDVLTIRRLFRQGVAQEEISRQFNVHPRHISDIVRRKVWRHV